MFHPTRIFDRSGKQVLYTFINPAVSNAQYYRVSSESNLSLSHWFVTAVIEKEDPFFWNHPGYNLDCKTLYNLTAPCSIQEKIIDRFILVESNPIKRLFQRYILALQITRVFGRERILEWFVNNSYYGRLATGIDAAAQTYFKKKPNQLNLAESALLAVLIDSPNDNPIDHSQISKKRRDELLLRLLKSKKINNDQYAEAVNTPLPEYRRDEFISKLSFNPFIQQTIKQLADIIGWQKIEQGGLDIISTQDTDLQKQAECLLSVDSSLLVSSPFTSNNFISEQCPIARYLIVGNQINLLKDLQANIIVMDSLTSQVIALASVPNVNQNDSINLGRPAGTLLFPFYYLAGLMNGLTTSSILVDQDGESSFHFRSSLINQEYLPTQTLIRMVGKEQSKYFLEQFGIESHNNDTKEPEQFPFSNSPTNIINLAHAFSVLANNGKMTGVMPKVTSISKNTPTQGEIKPSFIIKVQTYKGENLIDWSVPTTRFIVDEAYAYLINRILSEKESLSSSFQVINDFPNPLSIVSGQTDTHKDLWMFGYTPSFVSGIWVGSDTKSKEHVYKLKPQNQLLHALIKYLLREQKIQRWKIPNGVIVKEICELDGKLPSEFCPKITKELFISGTEPNEKGYYKRPIYVNKETGKLATLFTPYENIKMIKFFNLESSKDDLESNHSNEAVITHQIKDSPIKIINPEIFSYHTGHISLQLSSHKENIEQLRILVGEGLYPQEWQEVFESTDIYKINTNFINVNVEDKNGLIAIQLQAIDHEKKVYYDNAYYVIDNKPPSFLLTYPNNNQIIENSKNEILLSSEIKDNIEVKNVIFIMDNRTLGTYTSAPYIKLWKPTSGNHVLEITAIDIAGNRSTKTINFKVSNSSSIDLD